MNDLYSVTSATVDFSKKDSEVIDILLRQERLILIAKIKRWMKGKTIDKEKMRQYLNTLKNK